MSLGSQQGPLLEIGRVAIYIYRLIISTYTHFITLNCDSRFDKYEYLHGQSM